jgi:phospholipid-binding lipoprotein MlaA
MRDVHTLTTAKQTPPRGVRARGARPAAVAAALLALAAPAAALAAPEDPWEPANRTFYMIHRVLDDNVFRHIADAFRLIPAPVRTAVRNIIANLGEPGVAANDALQGHPDTAIKTGVRMVANTTVGIGGIFDVAQHMGLPHHDNNFADTFGRWGAPTGPYLFITMIGPTDVRDGLGSIADTLTDPFTWTRFYHRWTAIDARDIWGGIDERAEASGQLTAIDNMSTDSYATLRSLYLQNRAQVIAAPAGADTSASGLQSLPDFGAPSPTSKPSEGAAPDPLPPFDSPAPAAGAAKTPTTPQPEPAPAPKPAAALDPNVQVLSNHRNEAKVLAALRGPLDATL